MGLYWQTTLLAVLVAAAGAVVQCLGGYEYGHVVGVTCSEQQHMLWGYVLTVIS